MVVPKHIAIITKGSSEWAKKNNRPYKEGYIKKLSKIAEFLNFQVKNNIPIMTYYALSTNTEDSEKYTHCVDALVDFFNRLLINKTIHDKKIKVSVLGKWYNLPGRLVDTIKKIIEDTKDYDNFFFNLCINYNGQEEIVDACRLISKRVELGKLDPDSISTDNIKEDLYSSYFLPPELIVVSGGLKKLNGFLLWDSVNSTIFFSDKLWPDFNDGEMTKALKYWEKYK